MTELSPLFLSRMQFAFTIAFHIVFPAFTIGLAAWLAVLEGLHLRTGAPVYRRLFEFWLRIFAVAFGLGVVSDRNGVPVRDELERARPAGRAGAGPAPGL